MFFPRKINHLKETEHKSSGVDAKIKQTIIQIFPRAPKQRKRTIWIYFTDKGKEKKQIRIGQICIKSNTYIFLGGKKGRSSLKVKLSVVNEQFKSVELPRVMMGICKRASMVIYKWEVYEQSIQAFSKTSLQVPIPFNKRYHHIYHRPKWYFSQSRNIRCNISILI